MNSLLFTATAMPDQDWWHALWPDPDSVIKALQIHPGMTVIDLGCGDGYFTASIARQIAPDHVTGLDLDATMLTQAQAACAGMTNCGWLQGDAMVLRTLITTPVDYILIANTFHGVPDATGLASEVAASLVDNGRFAIINWHPLPREQTPVLAQARGPRTEMRMSVARTQNLVEPAGFRLETVIEFPPYHYGVIFKKQCD